MTRWPMRTPRLRFATLSVLVITVGACAAIPAIPAASPDPRYQLHVDNGTTVPISIIVNGASLARVNAASSDVLLLAQQPSGIVTVQAQLPDGRSVIEFAVDPSTLSSTTIGSET